MSTLCLCSTVPAPRSSHHSSLRERDSVLFKTLTQISAVWFAFKLLTCFTFFPCEAVRAQTEHVLPRSQGGDGGASIQTDPTWITKEDTFEFMLGAAWREPESFDGSLPELSKEVENEYEVDEEDEEEEGKEEEKTDNLSRPLSLNEP